MDKLLIFQLLTVGSAIWMVFLIYLHIEMERKHGKRRLIERNKRTFVTRLFNPANGYLVKVKYKLKDKNNLICKFSGDLNKTIHLTRYKVNLKDKLKK